MQVDKANRDRGMASAMKAAGIERTSGRCPLCNRIVGVGRPQTPMAVYPHVALCHNEGRRKGRRAAAEA